MENLLVVAKLDLPVMERSPAYVLVSILLLEVQLRH
jgi:hypothetical protein